MARLTFHIVPKSPEDLNAKPEGNIEVREVIKEVPVEVIKEVEKLVYVDRPIEVIKEVIKEIPVEVIKEVPVEVIKEIPVEVEKVVYKEGADIVKIVRESYIPVYIKVLIALETIAILVLMAVK